MHLMDRGACQTTVLGITKGSDTVAPKQHKTLPRGHSVLTFSLWVFVKKKKKSETKKKINKENKNKNKQRKRYWLPQETGGGERAK